jgi:hypothetical protein
MAESPRVHLRRTLYALSAAIFSFGIGACGQTAVRPLTRTPDRNLPPPTRIFVYDFAASKVEVAEYQGILRQQPSNANPVQRRSEIARHASDALAVELVNGLRKLGFTAERAARGTPVAGNDLLIDGQFLGVDQGDPLRRLVIGFGSGASKVETRVQVYQGTERRKLLEFTTHAYSGKMPGAAATVPAGAVVHGGVTAGTVAGSAIATGVEAYQSDVARMAASSAEQAVRYLSEFFAKQGWIRPDQVKKARMAH